MSQCLGKTLYVSQTSRKLVYFSVTSSGELIKSHKVVSDASVKSREWDGGASYGIFLLSQLDAY